MSWGIARPLRAMPRLVLCVSAACTAVLLAAAPAPASGNSDGPGSGSGNSGGSGSGSGNSGGSGSGSGNSGGSDSGSGNSTGPVPSFNCAATNGDGSFTYFFGYTLAGNAVDTIPVGPNNQFTGGTKNLGQPTQFAAGRHPEVFSVTTTETRLQWHLAQTQLKADPGTVCSNVPVVAEAPAALVLPLAAAAPFSVWFLAMRRRTRRQRG